MNNIYTATEFRKLAKQTKKKEYREALDYAASIIERCYNKYKIYYYGKQSCSQNEDWCESHINLIKEILALEGIECPNCLCGLEWDEKAHRLHCILCDEYEGKISKSFEDAIDEYCATAKHASLLKDAMERK